jgi:hypothetical protein
MRDDLEGLRSQLCLIIVPTNDTTSMFIANCIWYLARHPEAWEKLRHEVAALGKDAPLTFDVLRTMPYLNGVMNESESEVFFFFFFFFLSLITFSTLYPYHCQTKQLPEEPP